MGDWLIIGILIFIIQDLSGMDSSALAISGLWIAKMLPIIFSPVVGTLVDTVDRKKGMIASDLVRGFLIALVPFIIQFNSLFLIYLIIFLSEMFTLFFVPAKDASIPNLVKKEQILDANSLSFSINQLTMLFGLALGTTIIITVNNIFGRLPVLKDFTGAYSAVYVDAFTFFISAVIILFIAFPKKEKKVGQNYRKFLHDIAESFHYLAANKKIRWLIISASFSILGLGTILIVGPGYAQRVLNMGKEGFLPLLTILAFGLLSGAVTVGFVNRFVSKELIFAGSLSVLGLSLLLFAFIPIYPVAVLLSLIAGLGLGMLYVSAYTVMHESISDEIRGRLFTTLEADIRLAIMLSALLTGIAEGILVGVSVNGLVFGLAPSRIILLAGGIFVTIVAIYSVQYVLRSVSLHGQTETSG